MYTNLHPLRKDPPRVLNCTFKTLCTVKQCSVIVVKTLPRLICPAVFMRKDLHQFLSENFFMVKGAALFLQQGSSSQGQRSLLHLQKHAGDLPQHLQVMINLLRCEDRIKLAVRLESAWSDRVRYMVVVYSSGRQDTEENILLGVDFSSKESTSCTIGMVLHLWSDTKIHLDGDGGFSVCTAGKTHVFKPVSVQAMWSALQILYKACEVARRCNYFPGGVALVWATYYESCISSDQSCINEWNTMQDLESTRPDSPALYVDKPTEGERTECLIKAKLRSIMVSKDLENVTSKEIRNELESMMNCNLKEYKEFIANEMLQILGQMDKATLIFDHLYLGSEWNASNLEELRDSGVGYILNVTREIDNFFPGLFAYHNIRVYDDDSTDLLAYWNEAYNFINKAKKNQSKCLVHCKMGVSRSASTVIAYAMKEFDWSLEKAYNYVKEKRSVTRPNAGFMRQLSEYEGILDASKQRHNKLWKQQTESNQNESDSTIPSTFQPENLDTMLENRLTEGDELDGGSSHQASTLRDEPQEQNYFFRCFPDSPLASKQADPGGVPLQVDDLERDALLDSDSSSVKQRSVQMRGKEESPAQSSDFGEKEVRKKLKSNMAEDWSSDANLNLQEAEVRGKEMPKERWKRFPFRNEESRLNKENANNNNSKRSLPEDFEGDAVFGILNKVKPSYQSCTECMYPSSQGLEEHEKLNPTALNCTSAICTQPSLNVSPMIVETSDQLPRGPHCTESPQAADAVLSQLVGQPHAPGFDISKTVSDQQNGITVLPDNIQKTHSVAAVKGGNSINQKSSLDTGRDTVLRTDVKQRKDLSYLMLNKDLEKPASYSYLMQHQESIIQLQKAGLVRKHTKELERLKSVLSEESSILNEVPTGGTDISMSDDERNLVFQYKGGCSQRAEALSEESKDCADKFLNPLDGMFLKTSTPCMFRLDQVSNYTKDFLKTISYTPSSSMSSNLTRSSSSDSIHSVRGKPGLVKQRTQEIETRMRLAGLTLSSPLKRSHSIAKLGCLTFSSEDLSSELDALNLPDLSDAKLRDAPSFHPSQSTPKKKDVSPKLLEMPLPGYQKRVSRMDKS
ncbi:protein phosphatase Slingshot homolog 1 isoform X2 [Microcaecilia unicolor]|uniref:Protein phosphatase Slingshot homolog 1 n=1 Tax=Microcaecilia unicolor TaxID=1415580 RepID=A0A6P7Z977_9AMPH|nr:protein phosphatase Slingshot homolog 1 isoform X2 [Microcaecilia unicolor]